MAEQTYTLPIPQQQLNSSAQHFNAADATPKGEGTPAYMKLPAEESFDKTAVNLLKVVRKLINESFDSVTADIEKKMMENMGAIQFRMEERLNEMNSHVNYVQKKQDTLLPLLSVMEPGKSLIDSISSYVTINSVTPHFNIVKEQLLPMYVLKEEMHKTLSSERLQTNNELKKINENFRLEIEALQKKCLFADTFNRFKIETQFLLDDLRNQTKSQKSFTDALHDQVIILKESNAKKADSERVWELQTKLEDYTLLADFKKVELEMKAFVTIESMEQMRQQTTNKFTYLQAIVNTLATKEDTSNQIANLKGSVYRDIKVFHKTEDFLIFVDKLEKDQKQVEEKFLGVNVKFNIVEEEHSELKDVVSLKAENAELQKLINHVKLFAYKTDIIELQSKVFPAINEFRGDMDIAKKEREQNIQILIRYDEVLTDKASKFMVHELRENIYRLFAKMSNFIDLEIKFEAHKEHQQTLHKENEAKFEEINTAITNEIYGAVRKAIKSMSKIVNKAQEEQDNKSKGLTKDLMNQISSKASQQDVESLNHSKANKVDTEQLLESIQVVHKQLKQALVLIIDSIRSEVENPNESLQSKEHKQKYILTQLNFLARWVLTYDPLNLNHTNQGDGFDYLQELEGKALQDYTSHLMKETSEISHKNLGSLPINFQNLKYNKGSGNNRIQNNQSNQTYSHNLKGDQSMNNIHSMAIMKSALANLHQGNGANLLANNKLIPSSNRSPINNHSQLSFISHQDQQNHQTLNLMSPQIDLKMNRPQLNIDIQSTFRNQGIKIGGRIAPKLETAPTSPNMMRTIVQNDDVKDSTSLVRRSPRKRNSRQDHQLRSSDDRQTKMHEKRTIELPPLI